MCNIRALISSASLNLRLVVRTVDFPWEYHWCRDQWGWWDRCRICIVWWRHKWRHFPRYWAFVWGIHRPPVNSSHKGQCSGALMFSFICAWTNNWVNNRDAGDLRRTRFWWALFHLQSICPMEIHMKDMDKTNHCYIFFYVYIYTCLYWWKIRPAATQQQAMINIVIYSNPGSWRWYFTLHTGLSELRTQNSNMIYSTQKCTKKGLKITQGLNVIAHITI